MMVGGQESRRGRWCGPDGMVVVACLLLLRALCIAVAMCL